MTTAKIGYDKTEKEITVTVNFFVDDFGAHLKKIYRYPSVQFTRADSEVAKIVEDYTRAKFSVKINNQQREISFKKFTVQDENVVQCKFFIPDMKGIKIHSMEVHNELLFDAFHEQVNIVRIGLDGSEENVQTMRFFPGSAVLTVKTNFFCD